MPGDGLTLAVTVRGEIELVDVFEQAFELADRALLVGADDVERFEVFIDVDPEAGPRLRLVLRRHVGGGTRQVADVSPGGLDDVIGAQVAGEFACFGRRLDDDESPQGSVAPPLVKAGTVAFSHLYLRSLSSGSSAGPADSAPTPS